MLIFLGSPQTFHCGSIVVIFCNHCVFHNRNTYTERRKEQYYVYTLIDIDCIMQQAQQNYKSQERNSGIILIDKWRGKGQNFILIIWRRNEKHDHRKTALFRKFLYNDSIADNDPTERYHESRTANGRMFRCNNISEVWVQGRCFHWICPTARGVQMSALGNVHHLNLSVCSRVG